MKLLMRKLLISAVAMPIMFSLQTIAGAGSASDVKALILKRIGDQEGKVKSEKDKLAKLYAERKILNPDKRFDELGKAAEEQVGKMAKGAVDQAKQIASNSPKTVIDNAKQGKSILETYQSTINAYDKALGEADREADIGDDITKQEKAFKNAENLLGTMKVLAAVWIPMLDAMAQEENRIEQIRQERYDQYRATKDENERRLQEAIRAPLPPPGPAMFPPGAPSTPEPVIPPTTTGPQSSPIVQPPVTLKKPDSQSPPQPKVEVKQP